VHQDSNAWQPGTTRGRTGTTRDDMMSLEFIGSLVL